MSSGRLFRSECFSAFRMCSFSVRQRLHRLDSLLYDCALLAIDQLMVNGFLFLFNCQMCLDSSYAPCKETARPPTSSITPKLKKTTTHSCT